MMRKDNQAKAPPVTNEATSHLLSEAIAALELCLECSGLTWEAEQAADAVVSRYKRGAR
jgi:hypothetical protein